MPTAKTQDVLFHVRRGAGLTHILRFFNLYGMLGRYIRPWAKIVGLLQHDLFHIYPVDDHILMVVRNMRRLAIEAHSHELPFASGLMASFPYKTVMYLAALFHDIAKGRGGDHADLGVADAAKFAKDHFLTDYEPICCVGWCKTILLCLPPRKKKIFPTLKW